MELFGIASSQWGVPRFITDLIALSTLAIFMSFPLILLKNRINMKNPWSEGNALSSNSN
tara:strand:- start:54 stop:230 length:177 start_codon:yes stop_codon:yes gene_type:complete